MLVLMLISVAASNPVLKTFYLNKKSQLERRPISPYEGRECAHTKDKQVFLDKQFTICYRHQPMVFNYRSGLISVGKINSEWSNLELGFVYGNYDSGEWIGFVEGLKPIIWIPMYKNLQKLTTQVWRHTCLAFDFEKANIFY